MTPPSLSFQQISQALDHLSLHKRNKGLTDGEKGALEAIWEAVSFEEVAKRRGLNASTLRNRGCFDLRCFVSDALGSRTRVSKKYLRAFVVEQIDQIRALLGITLVPPVISSVSLGVEEQSVGEVRRFQGLKILGGDPPELPRFVGREQELAELYKNIADKKCVSLVGPPGVGKSALAVKLIQGFAAEAERQFDYVIWKSVFYAPPLEELVTELNLLLSEVLNPESSSPIAIEEGISYFLSCLRSCRVLLVLDSMEALLQGNQASLNPYGVRHAAYGKLLRRLVEEQHRSRVLLLSRKSLIDVRRLTGTRRSAVQMQIGGMNDVDARKFLAVRFTDKWQDLISLFRGNPHALEEAANQIQEFFAGDVAAYLRHSILVDPYFLEAWDEQFNREGVSAKMERWVITHLAKLIEDETDPVPFSHLLYALQTQNIVAQSNSELMTAIESLSQGGLVETYKDGTGTLLSLPPLMKKYVVLRPQLIAC